MRIYLLLGIGLALASCAAQKALPQYTEAEKAAQRGGISYWQPDSTSRADTVPHTPRWALAVPAPKVDSLSGKLVNYDKLSDEPAAPRRLFGLLPAKKVASSPQKVASDNMTGSKLPRKCKGCTFNMVAGDQHNQQVAKNGQLLGTGASNTQTGKKSGAVIKADSGATVYNAETKKGPAAAGHGITQRQEEVKPGPWPAIIGGVGLVGGIGLVYWLVAGGGALWLAYLSASNLTTKCKLCKYSSNAARPPTARLSRIGLSMASLSA